MAKDFEWMEDSDRSANPSIHEVSDPARRVQLQGGIGVLTVGALAPWLEGRAAGRDGGPRPGCGDFGTPDRPANVGSRREIAGRFRQLRTSALGRARPHGLRR